MLRLLSLLAALSLCGVALAQAPAGSTAARQVELLAPQLVAFAGSSANFESLVNGLTQGTAVTLTTVAADGSLQIVTFVPGTALSPVEAARTLESARQALISRGIAAPTAQQLAVALVGGAAPIQVRTELAASPALGAGNAANLTAADLQALRTGLAQNTPVTLAGTNGNVTFTAPGRALSAFEINQALQLASLMLAQQGILDPTAEQLRAALLGGTIVTASGSIPLQGVLQGQTRNTSDSRVARSTSDTTRFGTSDSRVVGTSETPVNAGQTPRALTVPAAGAAVSAGAAAVSRPAGTLSSPRVTNARR
jgi:hypothetical protein